MKALTLIFCLIACVSCSQPFTFHDQAFLNYFTSAGGGAVFGTNNLTTYAAPSGTITSGPYWMGVEFTAPATNIIAFQLGRLTVGANTTVPHPAVILGGSGIVATNTLPAGAPAYLIQTNAITPTTLTANSTYAILFYESGADGWNNVTTLTLNGGATSAISVYSSGSSVPTSLGSLTTAGTGSGMDGATLFFK